MSYVPDRLMLLDTPSLYFRAFFGIPEKVAAPDSTPVNAVRGLLDFISFLVERHRPTRLVACMDADWRPSFRVELLPSYKAHRLAPEGGETVPPALVPQVAIIEKVLTAIGIPCLGVPGFEADDVIATLASASTCAVDVVTGDRDLFQLVRDDVPVRVVYIARGVGKSEIVDETAVTSKYAIPGQAYADFAVLRGDPSDGLPGVTGIGDKTAALLISRFGSLDALLGLACDGQVQPPSDSCHVSRLNLEKGFVPVSNSSRQTPGRHRHGRRHAAEPRDENRAL